ncbi:MAG: hypothetical protein ABJ311_10245 [Erythrobacter sp.]
MVSSSTTMLSFAAAALYAVVVLACMVAALSARGEQQLPVHARVWAVLAAFFVILVVLRIFNIEELLRAELRSASRESEVYGEREGLQLPITIGVVVIFGFAAFAWVFRSLRKMQGRRSVALVSAEVGALAMLILIVLRMVSFNVLDKILYGPLKLNWVVDLGAALLVGGGAVVYTLIVRGKLGRRVVRKPER